MRILYLTNAQTPHDLRFAAALAQTPHEIFVLSLAGNVTGWPEGIKCVEWEPIRQRWAGLRLQAPKLKKIIHALAPDVVHAGPIQGPAFLAAVAGALPLVSMSWGSDLLLEAGKNFQTQRVTRFTLARSDVLVGDSKCIEDAARQYGYRGPYFQFPWGVDLQHFTPNGSSELRKKLGWEDKTILLSMRSFEPVYDVNCILQAFRQVSDLRQDLRLLIVGSGSQEQSLRKFVASNRLEDKVWFTGRVNAEALPDIYRSAHCYISASHTDGASVSLLEALACGLPSLVSDIPGNHEWIRQGENGWLFKTGNASDLARYLAQFEKDSAEVTQMQHRNRALAEVRADWKKNFPVLLQAYEQALAIHRRRT